METIDHVSQARALTGSLSQQELEFLRGLVAGEAHGVIASRLKLTETEAVALRQSLMKKLRAEVTADAVRIGIYAGV